MKWFTHKAVSDNDFELLRGTDIMINMQKTRLLIVLNPNDKPLLGQEKQIGLYDCQGLVYYRKLQGRDDTIEILFELEQDRDLVQEHLIKYKMSEN